MATTSTRTLGSRRVFPSRIHSSCDFVQTLMKLQRAAQLITSTLDLDALLQRVVNDIADSIGCVEVSVWLRDPVLRDPVVGDMVLHGVRGCSTNQQGARLQIGQEGMGGHVAATGRMHYAQDVTLDPYYLACEIGTASEVSLPLKAGREIIGVLSVSHKELNAFSGDQLQLMRALAGHISVAIENARMFRDERLKREQMQGEAQEARAVQQSLFLKPVPFVPGFAFETAWHPAGLVAGDWYDFMDHGDGRHGIVLADVSGKGMPAAILMSATRAILRSLAKLHPSPGQTLMHLNRTLSEDLPMGKFVTMIYAVLDARSREITFASAGHLRPLLINGESTFLEVDTGLPLGLGVSSYPDHTLALKPGARLLFYTDGITEAMNRSQEEYGPERLLEHFLHPDAGVGGLIEDVRRFGDGSNQSDDATTVLIRSR